MLKLALILSLGAAAVFAQDPGSFRPFPFFPENLQKYLELNNAQVDTIRRTNLELDVYRVRKQTRMAQVQREIYEWTEKDPIDAMQLGVRYAEVETIRREIREEETKTVAKVRGTLNAAQLAKLKMLEDAVKLQPLIGDAVCENLMIPQPAFAGNIIPATRIGAISSSSVVTYLGLPTTGCAGFRMGDFLPVPGTP